MKYVIEKYYKGKSLGIVPNTGYDNENMAEKIKSHLQQFADSNNYNVKYRVIKI